MIVLDLLLNDTHIMELFIAKQEPLHGIAENAFDISLLSILIKQGLEEVAISFLLYYELAQHLRTCVVLICNVLMGMLLHEDFVYHFDFCSIWYLEAFQSLI